MQPIVEGEAEEVGDVIEAEVTLLEGEESANAVDVPEPATRSLEHDQVLQAGP